MVAEIEQPVGGEREERSPSSGPLSPSYQQQSGKQRTTWEYVIDPQESAPTLFRIDPPDACLCKTCVMNTPKSLDLEQRLEKWKIPFRGDWKTANAHEENTLLIVVTLFGVNHSTHFCLTIDETLTIGELNSVITKSARTCQCCCDLSPLPLILFLNNSNVCITPWGENVKSEDLLQAVLPLSTPTTLGMILYKMGAVKPRKCLDWNNLQLVHRVLWIEAYSLPIIESNPSSKTSPKVTQPIHDVIQLSTCLGDDLELMEKSLSTPGEKKLLDWFQRIASKHVCKNIKCNIECSPQHTPLAFAWYQWAKDQLTNALEEEQQQQLSTKSSRKKKRNGRGGNGNNTIPLSARFDNNLLHLISTAPLSTMIRNAQWTNVLSLAYEYYIILHLANHLYLEFSTSPSCKVCSTSSTKKRPIVTPSHHQPIANVIPSQEERKMEEYEAKPKPAEGGGKKKKSRRKKRAAERQQEQTSTTLPSTLKNSSYQTNSMPDASLFWIEKDEPPSKEGEEGEDQMTGMEDNKLEDEDFISQQQQEDEDEEEDEQEEGVDEDISMELEAFERALRVHDTECPRRQLPNWIYNNIQQVMSTALEIRKQEKGALLSCSCPCHH